MRMRRRDLPERLWEKREDSGLGGRGGSRSPLRLPDAGLPPLRHAPLLRRCLGLLGPVLPLAPGYGPGPLRRRAIGPGRRTGLPARGLAGSRGEGIAGGHLEGSRRRAVGAVASCGRRRADVVEARGRVRGNIDRHREGRTLGRSQEGAARRSPADLHRPAREDVADRRDPGARRPAAGSQLESALWHAGPCQGHGRQGDSEPTDASDEDPKSRHAHLPDRCYPLPYHQSVACSEGCSLCSEGSLAPSAHSLAGAGAVAAVDRSAVTTATAVGAVARAAIAGVQTIAAATPR